MKLALGSDHAGYKLKEKIKYFLEEKKIFYKDFGTYNQDSVNYVDFALKVAQGVSRGEYKKGILFCWTGIGVSIASNKIKGIRAAVCSEEFCAEMTRRHNDANILCLGSAVLTFEKACRIVEIFLNTEFEAGRHLERIEYIKNLER